MKTVTTTWVKFGGGTFLSTLKAMFLSICHENTDGVLLGKDVVLVVQQGQVPQNCFNGTFFKVEICNSPMKIWKLRYIDNLSTYLISVLFIMK